MNKEITAGALKLTVIGVLESRGSSHERQSGPPAVIIPLQTAKRYYGSGQTSYDILIAIQDTDGGSKQRWPRRP